MKRISELAASFALFAAICASCSEAAVGEAPEVSVQKVMIRFTAADGELPEPDAGIGTRTVFGDGYSVRWVESVDRIGVYVGSAQPTANAGALARRDDADGKVFFETEVNGFGDEAALYAYYPHAAENAAAPGAVVMAVPAVQEQAEAGVFNGASNPLAAVPASLSTAEDGRIAGPVLFRQLGAMAEFDIFDESEDGAFSGEVIRSVAFVAAGGRHVAGEFVYDLTSVPRTGEPAAIELSEGAGSDRVTVSLAPESGAVTGPQSGSSLLYMTIVPGTYTGDLMVSTDRATYVYPDRTIEFPRAYVRRFKIALNRAGRVTRNIRTEADWKAFAAAVNGGGDYSGWVDALSGAVNLCGDISVKTNLTRIQKEWNGIFDGNGHTLTQEASTVPLFTVIGGQGAVRNLRLAGRLTEAAGPTGTGTAALAQINYGTVADVVNGMDVNMTGVDKSLIVAGMVVRNAGTMERCEQRGDIDVEYDITANINTFVGGVACFASEDSAAEGARTGRFVGCRNSGSIRILKSGDAGVNLGKFAAGGICAMVEGGTAGSFALFEGCENSGTIYRRDRTQGSNMASCVGGIVGRVCSSEGQALDLGGGHYVRIAECRNTGTVENACWLVNGMANGTNTGERLGYAGGIVGAVIGTPELRAEISGCTNTGEIRGGHAVRACVMGGIAGLAGYANIVGSVSDGSFRDTESVASPGIGAIGGLAGYVRFDTLFGECGACADISVTNVFKTGLCAGGVYKPASDAPTAEIADSKFAGRINATNITEGNFSSYLTGFGAMSCTGNSFWIGR